MSREDEVAFLQWALPRLGLRWAGYRKVRRQAAKRVRKRLADLGLENLAAYRAYLEAHAEEWAELDRLVHITISRFYRDREVFDALRAEVLPALMRPEVRVWSAGCAGGEEPYTLALIAVADGVPMRVLATDNDEAMLARARTARYEASSLKELPEQWRREAHGVRAEHRALVEFAHHDVRGPAPPGEFDLILCRYLAFTYFDEAGQQRAARTFADALRPGGVLVVGTHETVSHDAFEPWPGRRWIYRRT